VAETISLARALSKLKTTEKEIAEFFDKKENPSPLFVSFKKIDDSMVHGTTLTTDVFKSEVKSKMDKINNLLELQRQLKRKISEANNKIKVMIIGQEMTITEAIFYKETIKYKKQLMDRLRVELLNWKTNKEATDKAIEDNARALVNKVSTPGLSPAEIEERLLSATTLFSKGYKLEVIDPLDAFEVIKRLENDIKIFEAEIDFVLNEKNSQETITLN